MIGLSIDPVSTKLGDRMVAYMWEYEYAMSRIRNITAIIPHQVGKKDAFRLPRKLKKKIKKHMPGIWDRRTARFALDVFKTSKYYGTKILKER